MGTPFIKYSLGQVNCPARYARPRPSRLRRIPRVLRCRHQPEHTFHAGASHRALRHPREARLTPQAPIASRERSQRYSRRARRDAATGRHAPAGDWLRRSPKSVWSIWAARGAQARQRLHQGHFLVLFVARDKKYNQRRADVRHRTNINSSCPCRGHCACKRRNVCAPHSPCHSLAEPIARRRLPRS